MRAFCRIATVLTLIVSTVGSGMAYSVSFSGGPAPVALRWRAAKAIPVSISSSLLAESPIIKPGSDVAGAIQRSLEAWEKIADVKFRRIDSEKLNVSPPGVSGDGVSLITVAQTAENTLLFAKDPERAAATTRIFYNGRGVITEADIVLNPYQQFSTDGTPGTFDLESTLTHEIGHLLGLDHSLLLSSTMHLSHGKNGTYGLQNFAARSLSAEDIAAVRAKYGPPAEDVECCGGVSGKLTLADGKPARSAVVWLEDRTGRVQGLALTGSDGSFRFAGLEAGEYVAYAEAASRPSLEAPAQNIGEVSVESGVTAPFNGRIEPGSRELSVTHLGLNGELSDIAVPVSTGRNIRIYLGGQNLDPKRVAVRFNTSYLSVVPGSYTSHDYGEEVAVISFEVRVDPRIPSGEYTILAGLDSGRQVAVPGGLTVGESQNAWTSPALSGILPDH